MTVDRGDRERELNLRRLLLARVVAATGLLLPVLYFQLLSGANPPLIPVYTLIAITYAASVLFVTAQRWMPQRRGFVAMQLTTDVLLTTAAVYLLGGIRSPLVLLYLIIAVGAGVMTGRQTALAIACLNGVAYGLMAHLSVAGWLPRWDLPFGPPEQPMSPAEMYLRIFMLLLSSCAMTAMASAYVGRLRLTRVALRQERSALEAMQRLNQQLLAGMSSGLIAVDSGGRIIACNRAAERITERPEAELVGAHVEAVLGLDAAAFEVLDDRLERLDIYRTERQIQVPEGGYRTVGMSVTRVTDSGGLGRRGGRRRSALEGGPWILTAEAPMADGYIFMFQDLTDIKRMERMFWMRERMALLGEMASSLAHEIRNPLASISGSLQVLRRADVDTDAPRSARLMDIVTRESERLSHIIEGFLDYARPEKLDAVDADLVAVARDTVELLENSPELRPDHELVVEADHAGVRSLVDTGRVKQVFWNLARNAVQAMPEGGRLRIRLRRTEMGAEVVFEDQGSGMSAEQIDRIFRPFVSEGGTGLGLAVVYRIMQQHGGRIEVESEPGRGSRFVLQFEDAAVPEGEESLVVVEPETHDETRRFDELSRSVHAD